MTAEGPPDSGAAGRSPSGLALVADSVRGMGRMAACTYSTLKTVNIRLGATVRISKSV